MSYKPRYDRGDWKCICDSCGRIVKASQLKKRWDGFMVDERCWEPRQPQDFVRGVADYQAPPFTRPEAGTVWPSFVNWFVKSTATLTMSIGRRTAKAITAIVTSVVTIAAVKFSGLPAAKAIDGSAINKTTLG